ncbi:MAG TPA: YchJ family metal-binding protein [Planctomycetota bacterium]|nr:YchJ family metal-binding protein [Planctomycetota bacterium]
MSADCPCCSGLPYDDCCGPLHAGAEAITAEALMRSRFSAFARRNAAYLIRTSHPSARARMRPGDFREAFALVWTRLEVLDRDRGGRGDAEGVVRFRAHYRAGERDGVLAEISRFTRDAGAWVYRDARGEFTGR